MQLSQCECGYLGPVTVTYLFFFVVVFFANREEQTLMCDMEASTSRAWWQEALQSRTGAFRLVNFSYLIPVCDQVGS